MASRPHIARSRDDAGRFTSSTLPEQLLGSSSSPSLALPVQDRPTSPTSTMEALLALETHRLGLLSLDAGVFKSQFLELVSFDRDFGFSGI